MHYTQDFKIVCNIVRATGIPVRISCTDDKDDGKGGRTSPESANVFLMQSKFSFFVDFYFFLFLRCFDLNCRLKIFKCEAIHSCQL